MTSADMSVDVTVFLDSTTAAVSRIVSSPISLNGSADQMPLPPADQSSLDPDCVVVLPHDTLHGQADQSVHHTTDLPTLVQVHLDSPVVCVYSPTPITHLATAGIVHAHTDNNVDTSRSEDLSDQHSQHSKFILDVVDIDAPLEVVFNSFDTRADLESKHCGHCQRTPPPGPLLFKPTLERHEVNAGIRKGFYQGKPFSFTLPSITTLTERLVLSRCGSWLWGADLSRAYRQPRVCPLSAPLLGIAVENKFYIDITPPFDCRISALACARATRAVVWLMRKKGFFVICYLDNFVGLESTKELFRGMRHSINS